MADSLVRERKSARLAHLLRRPENGAEGGTCEGAANADPPEADTSSPDDPS
jgi:hypothetical protein